MNKPHLWSYNSYKGVAQWDEIVNWCRDNLYHGGYYEPNWSTDGYDNIFFTDPKEYQWFLLRWS